MMTLAQLRDHALFPFADFRSNDASFLMLELFWTAVAAETLGPELSAGCVPLQACERDNGDSAFFDPVMLDFWLPDLGRGARVVLLENHENLPPCAGAVGDARFNCYAPFAFYLQRRGIDGPDDMIDQVVCRSDLSDAAVASVQNVLRAFLVERASLDLMEAEARRYGAATGEPTAEEWADYLDRKAETPE